MRNRTREYCTSGSVRDEGGDILIYSAELCTQSMDAVRAKLKQAILYIERNPGLVRSMTSFPYIINSL